MKKSFLTWISSILLLVVAFTSTAQDTVEAKQTSYLMDTGNVYTYQYGDGSKYYLEFWKKDNAGYFNWRNKDFGTGFKETKAGLYHEGVKRLAYPIEKGKKWSDPLNDTIYIIKSINRLIKTPAGTFEKVVEVRATTKGVGGYSTSYYAPSKGEILSTINNQYTDFETEVHFKLIKITRGAQASSVQKLVDKQLETVKKQKISGYQFYEAYPVKFTGKDIPEVVVSSYRFEKKGFILSHIFLPSFYLQVRHCNIPLTLSYFQLALLQYRPQHIVNAKVRIYSQ